MYSLLEDWKKTHKNKGNYFNEWIAWKCVYKKEWN